MIFQFYLHQLHHLHFITPIPLLKSSMMTLSIFTSTHMISTLHPTFHPLKLINSHSRFSKISISSILTDSSWIFILQILHCIFYSHIKYNSLTIPWSPTPSPQIHHFHDFRILKNYADMKHMNCLKITLTQKYTFFFQYPYYLFPIISTLLIILF